MKAVVAAGERATAEAAAEILRAGGNAVDAAIAATAAAFAAEPLLCSAGGGGLMTVAAVDREPEVIDFFCDAPGLGDDAPASLDFEVATIDFGTVQQDFHVGRGAVAVPCALPGLACAHRRHGSLPLPQLVGPACALARDGTPVSAEIAMTFELLVPIVTRDRRTAEVFYPLGRPPRPGEAVRNPMLADTLEHWAETGRVPTSWNQALLDQFGCQAGGVITEPDIVRSGPRVLAPAETRVGAYLVELAPLVGGKLVAVILDALTARAAETSEVDIAAELARASALGTESRKALIPPALPGSTTHVSVLDAAGGVAAVTLSNGEGCGHLLGDTGVQLNNFLGEEDLNPHGFHRHRPGERLPTMMAPTVVRRDGRPVLALGSGGANRIRTALAQTLYRALVLGLDIEDAVRAPRLHAEGQQLWFEAEGFAEPDAVAAALAESFARLHRFDERAFFFGGVHAVGVDREGQAHGIGDCRRGGVAVII